MTTSSKDKERKPLSLNRPGRLELKKTVETGQVRQSFSHGRSKAVTVEVKRKRTFAPGAGGRMTEVTAPAGGEAAVAELEPAAVDEAAVVEAPPRELTDTERAVRLRALETAKQEEEQRRIDEAIEAERRAAEEAEAKLREEEEAKRRAEEEAAR